MSSTRHFLFSGVGHLPNKVLHKKFKRKKIMNKKVPEKKIQACVLVEFVYKRVFKDKGKIDLPNLERFI